MYTNRNFLFNNIIHSFVQRSGVKKGREKKSLILLSKLNGMNFTIPMHEVCDWTLHWHNVMLTC